MRREAAAISPIAEIVAAIRAGEIVILVDDEDRENEGDLVFAAEFVTPEKVNFLAKHGRGLICMPITEEHAQRLGLRPMVEQNRSRHGTNFTVSIEAAEGIATGISAHDRALTIKVAASRKRSARRHRAARARLPADRAARRRAGARRPHRGLLRPRAPRRAHAGGGAVRDHAATTAPWRGCPICVEFAAAARPEDRHHRRPDRVPQPQRVAGAARARARGR